MDLRRVARRTSPAVRHAGFRVLQAAAAVPGTARYVADWRRYRALPGAEPLRLRHAFPKVGDRMSTSPYDPHYFFQDVWAARSIAARRPERHVDVGSRVDLVGFLTAICPVTFVDIRPLEAEIDGLTSVAGSVLELPFEDGSLPSVSCLHVAEHIGLGRYGDPLDPAGTRRAAAELARVLAPGGTLLFSLPVGRERVEFNAHRVHDPQGVPALFAELELVSFAGVGDDGRFAARRRPAELAGATYACGMYELRRS